MPGNVVADPVELRAVNVDTDPQPVIRWMVSAGVWYQVLPEAGGEVDDGDLLIEPDTQPAGGSVWWHKGTVGAPASPLTIPSGATSPIGAVVPPAGGDDPYNQITASQIIGWISVGATNADWRPTGGTAEQQTFAPNRPPFFPGEEWQQVTVDTAGAITADFIFTGVDPGGASDPTSWRQLYP